jgi:LacI family transcriptional regulator
MGNRLIREHGHSFRDGRKRKFLVPACDRAYAPVVFQKRNILLWVPESFSHGRDIVRGVVQFARHRPDWEVQRQLPGRRTPSPRLVARAHGIIAFINNSHAARAFACSRKPLVNVSASLPDCPWPVVANDDLTIGRMAAEHFLERGYRSFAYVGHHGAFAPRLEEGFASRLKAENLGHLSFAHGSAALAGGHALSEPTADMVRWARALPSATAVFAVGNLVGAAVVSACKRAGRGVPDEVAVLGVNNDEIACESVNPPLSSIQTAGEQVGCRAVMLLADLLAGADPPKAPTWVPPLGVVVRASTEALATRDSVVVAALRFIRGHLRQSITVEDVLDELVVSRKSLERKFRQHLGRTPLEEIRRLHLQEAQHLLIHTDYPMAEVARRSGFARPQHMATVFHRAVGATPTAYRLRFRNR